MMMQNLEGERETGAHTAKGVRSACFLPFLCHRHVAHVLR
jgi:hypothetical protein